ncbi:MAG TPA: PAS domain S-box protein, partial [Smithellaceae bacterium]|nr:PAS domain S-box protein [Smithellaceae bacterium]
MKEDKTQKQPATDLFILQQEIAKLKISAIKQKKTIDNLKRSEDFFRSVTQHATDIIIIVSKRGRFIYVSPSVEHFLGYEPEELVGKSAFNYIASEDLPRAIYDFGRAILTNNIVVPNFFGVRHKDGSIRILEGVGKNLFGNPAVKGFVMNVRDITERRETEKELTSYRKHLEELVDKRTAELEKINAQLRIQLSER